MQGRLPVSAGRRAWWRRSARGSRRRGSGRAAARTRTSSSSTATRAPEGQPLAELMRLPEIVRDCPRVGTGKTYLAELIATAAHGRAAPPHYRKFAMQEPAAASASAGPASSAAAASTATGRVRDSLTPKPAYALPVRRRRTTAPTKTSGSSSRRRAASREKARSPRSLPARMARGARRARGAAREPPRRRSGPSWSSTRSRRRGETS